jgi:hypothetical protein
VEILAPIVIRSGTESSVKGRDRKVLDSRKKSVLEAFLHNGTVGRGWAGL